MVDSRAKKQPADYDGDDAHAAASSAGEQGHESDVDRLLPGIYDALRRIASNYMRSEKTAHTLQPTALVHEAYVQAVGDKELSLAGKTHLLAICAKNMRRILVDHARRRSALKRGGIRYRVPLLDDLVGEADQAQDLLMIDDSLTKLATIDPRQADLVELRVFSGLTVAEAAQALGMSKRTAEREWTFAKAWLRREFATDAS